MFRSLIHYRLINIAVLLSSGVATAVLCGALMVGDSMRGSLSDLALERLGRIDHALVSEQFFRQDLVSDLAALEEFQPYYGKAVPLILLRGSATHAESHTHSSGVQILGIDRQFFSLFSDAAPSLRLPSTGSSFSPQFPPIAINAALQRELAATVGDPLLLSIQLASDTHRESVVGNRQPDDLMEVARFTLTHVFPDRDIGRFGLHPHQSYPHNVFVGLELLQRTLSKGRAVNALVVAASKPTAPAAAGRLQELLGRVTGLEDLGLGLVENDDYAMLQTSEFFLPASIVGGAMKAAAAAGVPAQPTLTYLANSIATETDTLPYSTVAAFDPAAGHLETPAGVPWIGLEKDEILLNQWAAEELRARPGERVELSFYMVGSGGRLITETAQFRLKGIVAMTKLGASDLLTPVFPGMGSANDVADWDVPFHIDLDRIRPRDEDYWDQYGAAPKAFVSLAAGRGLWSNRFGNSTGVLLSPQRSGATSLKAVFDEEITPAMARMVFQPVKAEAMKAATGSTDFGTLFLGFSLFLISAAAVSAAGLFRMGVENRSREIGVLLALGHRPVSVLRRFLVEGGSLAALGGLVGLGGALLYGWLMVAGLRTWWLPAVGTPFLRLHVRPETLVIGYLISLLIVLSAILLAVRGRAGRPVSVLLSTKSDRGAGYSNISHARPTAAWAIPVGLLLLPVGGFGPPNWAVAAFFGSGGLLLVGGLGLLWVWLGRGHNRRAATSRWQLAIWNSARNPGRSILSAGLVACACFIIVAVGANRVSDSGGGVRGSESATGGFAFVGETQVPLHLDLNRPEDRFKLGFSAEDERAMTETQVFSLRLLPGGDVSCLNLYLPQKPRILGVPKEMVERGGFRFRELSDKQRDENPWNLLQAEFGDGTIPAFGDANSMHWIMHLGLGDELELLDEAGQPLRLRLVGLLETSIYQSEILISEQRLQRHFPSLSGHSFFLVEQGSGAAAEVKSVLEKRLRRYGFDLIATDQRLAAYREVENTYLSTFQSLGGLGLLLGTLGLGLAVVRNVAERRGELATLQAVGFRHGSLASMLSLESGFVLIIGIALGTVTALIAVAPRLVTVAANVEWIALTATLLVIFLVGLLVTTTAVYGCLRTPLLRALKTE